MGDILQKMLGVSIEFNSSQDKMKIDFEGSDDNFYADLDEVLINPKIVNLRNLIIKKNGIKFDFNAPIICNVDNVLRSSSMMGGVKFEGVDKRSFIERIEDTARNFGPEWERAVERRKRDIISRNSLDK